MTKMYKINKNLTADDLTYYDGMRFDFKQLEDAVIEANKDIREQYNDARKYKASLLMNIPMKNLSGAVGEVFGQILANITGTLKKNPHESGAPDFLPITESSKPWIQSPTRNYFTEGGFDTKASFSHNREFSKVSASSHHDQTTTVLVVQWSFSVDEIPEIIGIFYTNKLTRDEWKLSVGRTGSKTTNAADMTASGKDKLRKGWIILRDDIKLPQNKIRKQYGL